VIGHVVGKIFSVCIQVLLVFKRFCFCFVLMLYCMLGSGSGKAGVKKGNCSLQIHVRSLRSNRHQAVY
jgi:hypothetical protein